MKRDAYLAVAEVQSFLSWARPFVTGERALRHKWSSKRLRSRRFETLGDAYHQYDWPFSCHIPGESEPRQGRCYEETVAVLDDLGQLLQYGYKTGDATRFLKAAIGVVEWGGVRQNRKKLKALEPDALTVVCEDRERLDPARADLGQLGEVRHLNAGFSKIHALLSDDFPMYDSRVACALASLVRRYCEETCHDEVPQELALSIPPARGSPRNPSHGNLRFRDMRWGDAKQYASSNVIAAWLLRALADHGEFGGLEPDQRLRALQSAMFMLGYCPVTGDASFPRG